MSNQVKRMRASSCKQKEGFERDQHSQANQGLRNPLLHQETKSKRRKCQGLLELPISSWIESKNKNGSVVSSSFDALKSAEATNIMTSHQSIVPSVSNSTSHASDDTLVFPNSFLVSLRAQTRGGVNIAGDIPADTRVARVERKREINRQSAQRKRQREKDQLEFLSEKHHELRLKNEELKREKTKIMEMIEAVKSGKIVSSEPMSISSSTTPIVPNPKLPAADPEKTSSDPLSRLDMLTDLAKSCGQNPVIGTTLATNWCIQDLLPPAQSNIASSSVFNILPATTPGSANIPVAQGSAVALLLAALLQGKPEMVQLLKEFVDNEVARQKQIEEQRQKQLKMNLENSTSLSILMGMALQNLMVHSGNVMHDESQTSRIPDTTSTAAATIPPMRVDNAYSSQDIPTVLMELLRHVPMHQS